MKLPESFKKSFYVRQSLDIIAMDQKAALDSSVVDKDMFFTRRVIHWRLNMLMPNAMSWDRPLHDIMRPTTRSRS